MRFVRRRGAVEAKIDRLEAQVLRAVVTDLLELLGPAAGTVGGNEPDPLAAMVGLSSGPTTPPEDPALARLLPDAYGDDDEAAAEFRRFTEEDLRAGKRASAGTMLDSLALVLDNGGRLALDREQADAWLTTLNDLRLVLGTRLEVTEDSELAPRADDPQAQAMQVYGWLGWLQESLLRVLEPRTS